MSPIIMIFFALIFFIYSIFMLIIVTAYRDRQHAKFIAKVDKNRQPYSKWIRSQLKLLEEGEEPSKEALGRMNRWLDDEAFVRILDETFVEYSVDTASQQRVMQFMMHFKDHVIKNMLKHSNREGTMHIHSVFQAGVYRIDDPQINNYLMEALDSNSLYLKHNALRSLANIGNVSVFIGALKHVSWTRTLLNHKVLLDIINNFSGNRFLLQCRLVDELRGFDDDIKRVVIDALRLKKDTGASELLYEMLLNPHEHLEVKMAIVRFFGAVRYYKVADKLVELMDHERWEYRVASANALVKYKSEKSIDILLRRIGDSNWYVRFNTAQTLLAYDISDHIVLEILNSGDRYAADVMEYALFLKKRIVVEGNIKEEVKRIDE